MNTSCAVIILGHGTRRKEASQGFFALVDRIGRRLWPALVVPACFSCGQPALDDQAAQLVAKGVSRIIIFPYFLLSGKHIADELPEVVQKLRKVFPRVRFDLLETMEDEPLLEAIVVTRVQGDVRENGSGVPNGSPSANDDDIIAGHFATTGMAPAHYPYFRALAQATGDLALAADLRMSGPVDRVYAEATASGVPVLCDSAALTAGVEALVRRAVCIPESVRQGRSFLKEHMSQGIVALGSSSVLLNEVLDLVREAQNPPRLVIALPPGFADAPVSKARLARQRDLATISNTGTGGGISCVLAMIRALDAAASRPSEPGI
jgi:sirohydrochlorin ferrochelatase